MRTIVVFFLSLGIAFSVSASPLQPIQITLWQDWDTNILEKKVLNKIPEPSGIVFHPQRKSLYIVSDEGRIAEISLKGKLIKYKGLKGANLEGLTVDPNTGLIYAVVEGKEQILEVHPNSLKQLRAFKIQRTFQNEWVFRVGDNGVESIAFVPNDQHAQGGTFFVAKQVEHFNENEIAYIAEIEVPLLSRASREGKIINVIPTDIYDISGMFYRSDTKSLILISDMQNLLVELTLQGAILKTMALPGYDQEGITIDHQGNFYLALDDNGDEDAVMKLIPRAK